MRWYMPPRMRRGRSGISMIEMLLVISIILILASIILPLISSSRQLSMRTRCAANLRQLYAAFSLYSQDWNACWPCPGGLAGNYSYWSQSGQGGLESYIKQSGNRSVWCCPLMPNWKSKYPARSYTMNSYLREDRTGRADIEYPSCVAFLKGIRVCKILEPSRTVLLFEGLPLDWGWEGKGWYIYIYRCCNWTGVRGYYDKVVHTIEPGTPWHNDRNNYLYCDGHVVARPPGERTVGELSTYKEMRQWYVDKAYFERIYHANWAKLIDAEQ